MNDKASHRAAIELAKKMSMGKLVEEYEKTENKVLKEEVKGVILNRRSCPDCGEEMMKDEKVNEYYCPLGHYEIENL